MESILASIPAVQVASLVKLLTIACAVISTGETSKELKTLATSVVSGAKRAESIMSVDVTGVLMRIIKGEEVEHDELKSKVRELRAGIRDEVKADRRKFEYQTIDFLKCTTAYLINNGEPALRKLRKLVNETGDKTMMKALVPEAKSQKDFIKPLGHIVQAVGKRKGTMLTKEESLKLKKKDIGVWKEYNRLRKQYNLVWRDEMATLVTKSGKKAIPYKDLYNYLTSKKIDNPLTPGFTGLIDANGKIYTTEGKVINGAIPPKDTGYTLKMNEKYDPKEDNGAVFMTYKPDGEISQHIYTVQWRQSKNTVKFQKVRELMTKIDKIQKSWLPFVKRHDFSRACVGSTILQIMWSFGARVGNKDNATVTERGTVSTFGISTLEGRHVKISGNTVTLRYPGKDAVVQVHVINGGASMVAKYMAANLIMFAKGKGPKERIFQYEREDGSMHPITSQELNGMFRKLGSPTTAHKIRHVRGTELFMSLVEENEKHMKPGEMSQAEGDALFKSIATQVGALLGHVRGIGKQQKVTAATAIQNYIDPSSMVQFYASLQLKPPRIVEKLASKSKE